MGIFLLLNSALNNFASLFLYFEKTDSEVLRKLDGKENEIPG